MRKALCLIVQMVRGSVGIGRSRSAAGSWQALAPAPRGHRTTPARVPVGRSAAILAVHATINPTSAVPLEQCRLTNRTANGKAEKSKSPEMQDKEVRRDARSSEQRPRNCGESLLVGSDLGRTTRPFGSQVEARSCARVPRHRLAQGRPGSGDRPGPRERFIAQCRC